jgi:ABC-type oligopeptide transport system ATPase subunit
MGIKDIKLDGHTMAIREFKLSYMKGHPSICMIAKRGSGKSWVCRSIVKYFKDVPGGVIIAPTDKMNNFYGTFFPELYIHYQYTSELIQSILYRQEIIQEKEKEKRSQGKRLDTRMILVMDDCLASKGTWRHDEPILVLFFNGRHYHIIYILTMQDPVGIGPELRNNLDYIFLLADDFVTNQQKLYNHFAGMFSSVELFRKVFAELTADFCSMVIVNTGSKKSLLDKVFYYKANDIKVDKIGCNQFNQFNKNNYDKNWRKRVTTFDVNKYFNKKNSGSITVEKIKEE